MYLAWAGRKWGAAAIVFFNSESASANFSRSANSSAFLKDWRAEFGTNLFNSLLCGKALENRIMIIKKVNLILKNEFSALLFVLFVLYEQ